MGALSLLKTLPHSGLKKLLDGMVKQGEEVNITPKEVNADIASLEQTTLYGLKGLAAYAYHAQVLGQK